MSNVERRMAIRDRLAEIDQELEDLKNGTFEPHSPKLDQRIDELTREKWRLDPESSFDMLGLR